MARPKPTIIMEYPNKVNLKTEQILEADAVYAVFYRDKPINVRTISSYVTKLGPKYKKSIFPNSGFALHLAERLNDQFNTTEYTVHKLIAGEQIR